MSDDDGEIDVDATDPAYLDERIEVRVSGPRQLVMAWLACGSFGAEQVKSAPVDSLQAIGAITQHITDEAIGDDEGAIMEYIETERPPALRLDPADVEQRIDVDVTDMERDDE